MPPDPPRRPRRPDRRGGTTPRTSRPTTSRPGGRTTGAIDPLIGHTIGGHKILQRTGSGAVTAIYKANHAAMARLVTFKALTPEAAANPEILQQFYDTAKLAAQVHHPNIVSIYDVSTAQDVHFCTMEFVEGRSVGELLRARQKIGSDDAVRVAIDVAEALRFANAKGMAGFQLDPDRVVLSTRGEVKILPPTLVAAGAPVLDDAYVVRAAGVLLYAMLSGGRVDDLGQALAPGAPAALGPIKRVAIGTRKDLAEIVDRMVGVEGARPYPTVDAALADLRETLQKAEMVETRTRTATERARERKRHGWLIAGILIGVGAVFALIIIVLLANSKARRLRARRAYAEAQRQANASIEQGKELWGEWWKNPSDGLWGKTLAAYEQAKTPYQDYIAAYRNAPEAQQAQTWLSSIQKAIDDIKVKAADHVRDLKERRAYKAVRDAFEAEVARKLETGGSIDEDAWRTRYADLRNQFPRSPWIDQRVRYMLGNLRPEIQRAEMKIEVNKLINDFREVHRPKHQYGKALAAWEAFRKKYDKIDHVRKDALTNAQTQTDMIKRDARVQAAQMMNRANYLAKEKKDYAKAREIYRQIIDNFGIPRHVEKAREALAKLPK